MGLAKAVVWLARTLAIIGGIVLIVLTVLTVASITGRAVLTIAYSDTPSWLAFADPVMRGLHSLAAWLIGLRLTIGDWTFKIGPVPGDFELVEAGAGFAIFCFLPWCQLVRGHATVDLFTSFLGPAPNRVIDLVSEFLMTVVIVLIAWRLWYGMWDKFRYQETTFILQFPVWWPYAACMFAAVIAVVVSVFLLWIRVREVVTGEPVELPHSGGGV